LDGAETGTGVWVSATNTGTDPLNADTDGDGLLDGVETNTGVFVNASNTGTSPLSRDTDGDTYSDSDEVALNTNALIEAQARLNYLASGVAPAVPLGFRRAGQNLILTWPRGILQSAGDVQGPWLPVAGATTPYTNAITGGNKFFRVLVQ